MHDGRTLLFKVGFARASEVFSKYSSASADSIRSANRELHKDLWR